MKYLNTFMKSQPQLLSLLTKNPAKICSVNLPNFVTSGNSLLYTSVELIRMSYIAITVKRMDMCWILAGNFKTKSNIKKYHQYVLIFKYWHLFYFQGTSVTDIFYMCMWCSCQNLMTCAYQWKTALKTQSSTKFDKRSSILQC